MGACTGCSQFVLVLINLLFSLVGLALLVVGCLVRFGSDVFDSYLQEGYTKFQDVIKEAAETENVDISDLDIGDIVGDSTIAFIVVGAFFFVLGIIGCIGAICKVKVLLTAYAIVLLVIFVVELIFVILLFSMKEKIDGWIQDPLIEALQEKYTGTNGTDIFTVTINFVMNEMECCGIENYTEFAGASHWGYNNKSKIIPYICCKNTTVIVSRDACVLDPTSENANIDQGCYEAVNDWLTDQGNILIGVGSGVAAVQLILIIFAFVICCQARKDNDDDKDDENEEYPIQPYREPKDLHGQQNMAYTGNPDRGNQYDVLDARAYPGGQPGYNDPVPYQGRTDRYNGPPQGYRANEFRR